MFGFLTESLRLRPALIRAARVLLSMPRLFHNIDRHSFGGQFLGSRSPVIHLCPHTSHSANTTGEPRVCHNLPMCGRYRLSRRKEIIEEQFDTADWQEDWSPRYNIAPTQPVPVVRQHPKEPIRQLSLMRWGLIPSWAKDTSSAARMINARSETAHTLPAFREAMKLHRCLVPADGFYEWQRRGAAKQPYCLEVKDGKLFAFAGLWDRWKDASGKWLETCTILTTTPNAVASAVHDRMPVILNPDSYDIWLDPGMKEVAAVSALLKPCDPRLMRCYPVSTRVNSPANDDEDCSRPVEIAQTQKSLFL